MDPILKQRLIGATVLSALAVIFVPMLFDDSGNGVDDEVFEIPEIPRQIEQGPVDRSADLQEIEATVPLEPVPVPKREPEPQPEPEPETAISNEPEKSAKPGDPAGDGATAEAPLTAWVIQVGSFSKNENAQQLRDRLRKAGYPAYVESASKNGAVMFRVRVGPELDQERARGQREKIAKKFKIDGIVLPVP